MKDYGAEGEMIGESLDKEHIAVYNKHIFR